LSTIPQAPARDLPRPAAWARLADAHDEQAFLEGWLELQCGMVAGTRHGVVVLGAADTGPFAPKAFWPAEETAVRALAEVAERSLAERQPLVQRLAADPRAVALGSPTFGLAFPVEVDSHLHGVVAIEVSARAEADLQAALRQLQWGATGLETWLRRQAQDEGRETGERLMTALDLIATVLNETSFDAAARALVTELAVRLNCDRVSLGIMRNGHARVVALSHSAQFGKRMNLIDAIGTAMEEAIDQRSVLVLPQPEGGEALVARDHERLAREHGSDSLLTVPFSGQAEFSGAVTLERPGHLPFDPATVEACRSSMAVLARLLELRQQNDTALAVRAWRASVGQLKKFFGPRYMKRKLAALAVLAVASVLAFATAEYRVTSPSTLEGDVRRTLVAPFDGYIAGAEKRAGDVVRSGVVLARLDDRDLRVERMRWAAQLEQYLKQNQEAVAARDRAKAQIAEAQAQQARAQVVLLDEQLARAVVRAPFDGIVAKGDLSQSLGGVVRRGETLFELTPLDAWRVIIQVDEGEIAAVQAGQRGRLALASIADEGFDFTVRRVTPVTTQKEGRNYFRVEAELDKGAASVRLRPGMEGVAKIEAGERNLFWIGTHRLVNWMRIFAWTWLP
jgi:multidrug efflux pump subunit AcrA (membrane-fusion protein)